MYKWEEAPWTKIQRNIFKLQKRIYQASKRGDVKKVRRLQKLLVKSWSAKMLAVRKVTQENKGKKTAGIDGIKSISPIKRSKLVNRICLNGKSKPTRRLWIPKPGKTEKRPLGIPTIEERAKQTLCKLTLEPEWEAKFDPNSYGFRPGRSAHDAIGAIFIAIRQGTKYVLDADISKCFDKINHEKLLQKVNTYPSIRRQLKSWLKAGYMDKDGWYPTKDGTPQGGSISPLLANIALNGMEESMKDYAENLKMKGIRGKVNKRASLQIIRYADDFVIMHKDLDVIVNAQEIISQWLEKIGLKLSKEKTSITHTLNEYEGRTGFNFLGFYIRQHEQGKHNCGKDRWGNSIGIKTIIKPSKESIKRHYRKMSDIIGKMSMATQEQLIGKLNPIIRGWCNYYSKCVSKEAFSLLDHKLTWRLLRWGYRKHNMKGKHWVAKKYWKFGDRIKWTFASQENELIIHAKTPITRHAKVKGNASIYDGNIIYWAKRNSSNPNLPIKVKRLMKTQKGKCKECNLTFLDGDKIECDHVIPKYMGGKDTYDNLQLLHLHCHDKKTARDRGIYDKEHISEERYEAKVSRTVLQTSQIGDNLT